MTSKVVFPVLPVPECKYADAAFPAFSRSQLHAFAEETYALNAASGQLAIQAELRARIAEYENAIDAIRDALYPGVTRECWGRDVEPDVRRDVAEINALRERAAQRRK